MTHVDSIGEYVLSLKLNLLYSKYIDDIFKVELLVMFLTKTFRNQFIFKEKNDANLLLFNNLKRMVHHPSPFQANYVFF